MRSPRRMLLAILLGLALAFWPASPAPVLAEDDTPPPGSDQPDAGAQGQCKITNLYYIFSNGRVYAFVRNDIPGKVVIKAKLKVGFKDKKGNHLGSKFLHVNDMSLPPHKSGIYFWVVTDYMKFEVGGIKLEGFWVWHKSESGS